MSESEHGGSGAGTESALRPEESIPKNGHDADAVLREAQEILARTAPTVTLPGKRNAGSATSSTRS